MTQPTRPPAPLPDQDALARLTAVAGDIRESVGRVVEGKAPVVRTAVAVLLAGGHLLVEDVPGLGKTMLAKALARSIDGTVSRIQFTPDLMPSDITGTSVLDPRTRELVFRPGPVFADVVIGDEINRASPKTQSALLESMEEHQVTVDGVTHALPSPFLVVATQNPVEMDGTYPLPEAQRDRFMARITMGYPSPDAEVALLQSHGSASPLDDIRAVTAADEVTSLTKVVRSLWASPSLLRYVVDLADATRSSPALRLGASPRGSLHLLAMSRAFAALEGRDHVVPEDVAEAAPVALGHRVVVAPGAMPGVASGDAGAAVIADLVRSVPVPTAH